jgi:uncharacterized membrane protein YdjX (TVP38/TMEM64 family)
VRMRGRLSRGVAGGRRARTVGLITASVLLVVAIVVWGRQASDVVPELLAGVQSAGAWAPVIFVLVYAVSTVALIPGAILSLAGGALFGIALGSVVVAIGATLGACSSFLLARHGARGWVERRLVRGPRLEALDRAVGADGLRLVFLLRLSPVVPFNILNYALGLTRLRFRDFLLASAGMIPGVVAYTYSGRLIGDVARVAAGAETERATGHWVLLGLGFLATVAAVVMVTRRARQALTEVGP